MAWFPALVGLVAAVLIALRISGTSSGAHWINLATGTDPRLIYGVPRTIRSDEWLVQQGWIVSQSHNGWSIINGIFPGGVNTTVLNELPSWDWSSIFRPHLWGYLFFGLDTGEAWGWWLPAVALMSGSYLLIVTLAPRRPIVGALVSIGVFFTPLVQWWYGASTMWPVAWALLAMAGIVWIVRDRRRIVRWGWGALVGYLAVTMAMGLYVPYILPCVLVLLFFAVGVVIEARPWTTGGVREAIAVLAPYLVAGVAAILIVVAWVFSRLDVIRAISSTVYPGARSDRTGSLLAADPHLLTLAGAPWDAALKANSGTSALGANSSEASAVVLIAVFLFPALVWLAVRGLRRGKAAALPMSVAAVMLLIAAYLFVPGWDVVARVLQLDKVPPERFTIALVPLIPVTVAVVLSRAEDLARHTRLMAAGTSALLAAVISVATLVTIAVRDPALLSVTRLWVIAAPAVVIATVLFFFRRAAVVGAALFLVASLAIGWNVNPIYQGVFDLSTTNTGKAVLATAASSPGYWVGVGSYETMAILVESGVKSFSGVQDYPSVEMWKEIDPHSRFEYDWNRLAHIQWTPGVGAPTMTNPSPDVVLVTFDACSSFAQKHVQHVLTDQGPLHSSCLTERTLIHQGHLTMRIYDVVAKGTGS